MKRTIDALSEEEKLEVYLKVRDRLKKRKGEPVGSLVYLYEERGVFFKTDKLAEDLFDEEEDEKDRHPLVSLMRMLYNADTYASKRWRTHTDWHITEEGMITIGTASVDIYDPKTLAELIRKHGKPACFGDMASNTTVHDPEVRSAIQVKDFSMICADEDIEKVLLDRIKSEIADFNPFSQVRDVRVVPHALNLYEVGGHFTWHLDTQRTTDTVGTITILLGDYKGGELEVRYGSKSQGETGKYVAYRYGRNERKEFKVVAMLASCPHRVLPVTEGVRISVTFDVLGKMNDVEGCHREFVEEARKYTVRDGKHGPAGIVLDHMYTADDIKNGSYRNPRDASLVQAAGEKGKCIQAYWGRKLTVPAGDNEAGVEHNQLFSFDHHNFDYADAVVFTGAKRVEDVGTELMKTEVEYAEHTGNESREGYDDAVYRLTVLMLH